MSFPFRTNGVLVCWTQGVLEFDYRELGHLDAPAASAILLDARRALDERDIPLPTPILVRMGSTRATRAARQVFATSPINAAITNRAALLATNPIAVAVGNFFLGLNRPGHPTRLFTDESAAIAWLKSPDA